MKKLFKNLGFVVIVFFILLVVQKGNCLDLGMHMTIAKQTVSIWQNFDPSFYNALTQTPQANDDKWEQILAWKFYYIGTTLPDLFWDLQQDAVAELINQLYEHRTWFKDALKILDNTHNQVSNRMVFSDHHSVAKLYQMVCYARSQNWPAYQKALIYGAYMHAVEDVYGHMVLQPSRYGYGLAIDDASCISDAVLKLGETYHELFSGTHIAIVDNYKPITKSLFKAVVVTSGPHLIDSFPLTLEFYAEMDMSANVYRWQELTLEPISRFVEAANITGYATANMTHDRLRAYLTGSGIVLGLMYGYWPSEIEGTHGGIIAHPNWSPYFIIQPDGHLYKMILPHTVAGNLPSALNFLKRKLWKTILQNDFGWLTAPEVDQNGQPASASWHSYFETREQIQQLYYFMPPDAQNQTVHDQMMALAVKVGFWQDNDHVEEPNQQFSYRSELSDGLSLCGLYQNSINSGSTYLDYHMNNLDIWTLSRKAGILGGMYDPGFNWYYRQPGVLNAGFKDTRNGTLLWISPLTVLQGDPTVNFFFDVIAFGPTKIDIIGKTPTGNEFEIDSRCCTGVGRWTDSFPINIQPFWSQGVREISYRISTKNKYGDDYKEMLASDYRQAFGSTYAISNNPLYQQWFNWGDPFRTGQQNPFTDPLHFWPYALNTTPSQDWYLNSPDDLSISSNGSSIRLKWYDESNWEGSYEIERMNLITNQSQTFQTDPYNGTGYVTWDDNNAQLGQLYTYKVRAKTGNNYSISWSNDAIGSVAYSELAYPTSSNNQTKVVIKGNNIHLVYFGCDFNNGEKIIYLHSSDNGNTWEQRVVPFPINHPPVYPAIALDQLGRPHILCLMWEFNRDQLRWRLICYHTYLDGNTWANLQPLNNDPWSYGTTGDQPPFSLPRIPFTVNGDWGYSAIIIPRPDSPNNPYMLEAFKFPLYDPSQGNRTTIFTDNASINSEQWNLPSLVIHNNRVVVCYTKSALTIRWEQNSATTTSYYNAYNPYVITSGENLFLAWYDDADPKIKFVKCQWSGNSYTQPTVEKEEYVACTYPYTAPRIINSDLVVYHSETGIYYMLRRGNNWTTNLVSNFNIPNNTYPQSFIGPSSNYASANRALNTYWTNLYDNKYCVISNKVDIPQKYYVACEMATGPNNGTHIMRVPNSKELYMVFQEQTKIYCSHSYDEGENWETEEIGEGLYPCIGLNYKGLPWIAYTHNGDLICKIKRLDGTYQETILFHESGLWAGQPSIALATMPIKEGVLDYAYLVYPVYDGDAPQDPIPGPPDNLSSSYIYITLFDTLKAHTHLLDVKIDPNIPLSHPCVAITPADLIHITWQQGDEIWYTTNTDSVTPDNWENVQWTEKYNLSNTSDFASEHPFVTSYGDIVSVVWKESDENGIGEIIRKQRYVWEPSEYENWSEPVNLSNSPDMNSDYPQMTSGNVVVWQEQSPDGSYKVYANICDNILCLTPNANNVSYVHANALVIDPKAPEIQVYYCYTDEISDNELYEVKFDKYLFPEGISGDQNEVQYYDGKTGEEVVSPYCESRTGYIDYGDYKIDYGTNLDYLLKYLDPCKNYLFQAIVYQDTTGTIRQRLEVEDTLAATMRVNPEIPETVNIFISPNSYQEDLASALEIIKTRGAFAAIADFKIYEYEVINDSGTGGGGQQSAGTQNLPIPTVLQSPKPNPFNNHTMIKFQIPVKTKVDLKIYNSTGRLVSTLIADEMNPGYYTMSWNGKDDISRTQGNGIYFIRLKTKDYDATKKMVLVR